MPHVVLAEDDANNRFMIAAHLKLRGYCVHTAANGLEALSLIHEERPDVVLLDLMMPVMNGYDACRELRADPATADLPVIALSALGEDARGSGGPDVWFDGFIGKPFRVEQLLAELTRCQGYAAA